MDTTEMPRRSAATTKFPASSQSSMPTLIFYGAVCLAILGIGNGIGWLAALGAIVVVAFYIPLALGAFRLWSDFRRVKRHPERYEAVVTEDAQGNVQGIKWKQMR